MENGNNKYLIVITLIDGQNFTVPNGAPDKLEATVFAEARFGNESVLRSDPIRLSNSNPEFITELAWQIDKKSLHQLRIERKAIKLQVFMQTREIKKNPKTTTDNYSNPTVSNESHKIELIGYTILDLRSAQQQEHPKFKWFPLLNPKFRKPSYNRPEIQLAITLNCVHENGTDDTNNQFSSMSPLAEVQNNEESLELVNSLNDSINLDTTCNSTSTKLYTTCLDVTTKSDSIVNDEIIDNDIIIRSQNGIFYVYDAKNPHKSSLEGCDERYELSITISFTTGLELLVSGDSTRNYCFSINLFGSNFKTKEFEDLTGLDPREIVIYIQTTHPAALATYFELNSNLDIRLQSLDGQIIAISTIQLNQICSLDLKCRSVEGIFALQPINETDNYIFSRVSPSIGVSVVLEKIESLIADQAPTKSSKPATKPDTTITASASQKNDDISSLDISQDTHQLTMDATYIGDRSNFNVINHSMSHEILVKDQDEPSEDARHYCFTIDLKKFSYTQTQRLIPTLRELIIRYSYPFFGYNDTIATDASIPINANSSIIVSGFCEFNFATTPGPLLTALSEIPLNLEILAVDETRLKELDNESVERVVATCGIKLADMLELTQERLNSLHGNPLSKSTSVPIYGMDSREIGQLQIYLCLEDLGKPSQRFKASIENLFDTFNLGLNATLPEVKQDPVYTASMEVDKLNNFIADTKKHIDLWKEEFFEKLSDQMQRRDGERFKRLYQRIEAKEVKRDQEFRRKMDELSNLEAKFKASLTCVDSLERMLSESLDHLKSKNISLDNRLNAIESQISQLTTSGYSNSHIQTTTCSRQNFQSQTSFEDCQASARISKTTDLPVVDLRSNGSDKLALRRSSLKNIASSSTNLPGPARSASLVRRPSEGTTGVRTVVRRDIGNMTPPVINGFNSRIRSNSARLNLSKETQEKLINLRKKKAELLKRGCKPSDELIQEINSFIEKLAC